MAITVDATPGGATANSYVTQADATLYMESHALNATWLAASGAQMDAALVEATRLLDEYVDWSGVIVGAVQSLRWPRSDVTDRDGRAVDAATIPVDLAHATAIFATELLATNRQAEREDTGLSSVGVGAISVSYSKQDKKKVIPESVKSMIRAYGTIVGYSSVSPVVRG